MLSSSCLRAARNLAPLSKQRVVALSAWRWNTTLVLCDTPLVEATTTSSASSSSSLAPDAETRSVLTAAADLQNPAIHLLVVGPQAPTVVPETVSKVRHLTDQANIVQAMEDAIANDTCTHILAAGPADKSAAPILKEADARFSACLVTDVVAVESRGTLGVSRLARDCLVIATDMQRVCTRTCGILTGSSLTLAILSLPYKGSFLVGDDKTPEQHKDMLKLLSIRADAFAPAALADSSIAAPDIEVVQGQSKSMKLAYKVLPVTVAGLVLLCCL